MPNAFITMVVLCREVRQNSEGFLGFIYSGSLTEKRKSRNAGFKLDPCFGLKPSHRPPSARHG